MTFDVINEETAIDVRGVGKSFSNGDQSTLVLRGVDFSVRRGEVMFIVGPSGCGKTTLLSILCGTLRADHGEVHALGMPLHAIPQPEVTQFRSKNVGFIFQQFNLLPTLTAAENVAVPLLIQGVPLAEAVKRASRMLASVGISEKSGERPNRLSGGQQQRVAIARALVHEPPIVVCDEPTSALDSASGHQIMKLLSEVARDASRSVIVVSHDPRIYGYADRIAEMEDGRILRVGESRHHVLN